MTTETSLMQSEKAFFPMLVTEYLFPIYVIFSGMLAVLMSVLMPYLSASLTSAVKPSLSSYSMPSCHIILYANA